MNGMKSIRGMTSMSCMTLIFLTPGPVDMTNTFLVWMEWMEWGVWPVWVELTDKKAKT